MTHPAVLEARKHVGKQFAWRGRDRVLDCSGLIVVVARALRLFVADDVTYRSATQPQLFVRKLQKHLDEIHVSNLAAGDVAGLSLSDSHMRHAGIYTGDDTIIHAHSGAGVIEEQFDAWRDKLVRVFRWPL